MSIERLGPLDPISNYQKNQKVQKPQPKALGDSVSVSSEAKLKSEVLQFTEMLKNTDDVRMDRVDEVRKKLEDPNYINDVVLGKVADRLIDSFGL